MFLYLTIVHSAHVMSSPGVIMQSLVESTTYFGSINIAESAASYVNNFFGWFLKNHAIAFLVSKIIVCYVD